MSQNLHVFAWERLDWVAELSNELYKIACLRGIGLDRVRVESDARAALAGAHADKVSMIVIAGTGSIVFGIGENR